MRRPIEVATMLVALLGAAAGNAYGQTAGQPVAERFVLSGVVVFDGGGGVAWLHEPTLTQSRVIAVRPGESIGSYRLEKILDDRVELKGPGGTVLVPLYSGAPAAVASTAGSGSARPGPAPSPNGPAAPGAEPAVKPDRAERQVERRARLEQALEKRAAAQKGSEAGVQPAAPSPNNSTDSADKLSPSNPYKDNPNVLFLPRGDPRRSPNWQSLRGAR